MTRFFLHGWGSTAAAFAQSWVEAGTPPTGDDCFIEGLEPDALTGRRRWFPFTGVEAALARHVRERAADVEARIAHELCARGLPADAPIGLVGHSQGGMLALQLALRAWLQIEHVECFAGFLPAPDTADAAPAARRTTVTLYGSFADPFVPPHQVEATVQRLRQLGLARVERRMAAGLAHAFSAAWLSFTPTREPEDA